MDEDLESIGVRINARLAELAPADSAESDEVCRAVRYSLVAPGKRLRPLITVMTAKHLGRCETRAYDAACAIEMVHTASLILDDLPAMDDASIRRSRPTNHRVFGEDVAILAAFALVSEAFGVLGSSPELDSSLRAELVALLSSTIGTRGIIGGQQADLRADQETSCVSSLQRIHHQKTAALFVAAAEFGARIAGLEGERLEPVREFAGKLGLAYQTRDDLIDVLATRETAGKDVGADIGKPNLIVLLGMDEATAFTRDLVQGAAASLAPLGLAADPLARMALSLFDTMMSSDVDAHSNTAARAL